MDLRYVQSLLVDDTRQKMASLAVDAPITQKAATLRDLSRLFQGVGICRLLVDADVSKFRENLLRSGQARRYHLRRSHIEHELGDRFLGLSRVEAIFDTIVAGDTNLLGDIVSLSVEEWHEGWEYEDDFCYYLFVHHLVTQDGFSQGSDAGNVVDRFERALQGHPSTRLELCRALGDHDATAFRAAFEAFLDQRRDEIDAKRPTMTEYTAQAIFWPASFVSVEGLAWLAIAERDGLQMDDTFQLCPDEARAPVEPGFPVEDFFASLDQALYGG